MTKCVLPAACALALCVLPTSAAAQFAPLDGRLTISINGLAQPGDERIGATHIFGRYDEDAIITTAQDIKTGGGMLDLGAAYRVTGPFGVGVAFTSFSTERSAAMDGSLPHPGVFGLPRGFSLTTSALEHRQRAVHLQAIYHVPFVENVDFALFAGPTFFSVSQGFARFGDFSEVGEPYTEVDITHGTFRQKENTVGFNLGGEVTYSVTRMIGVGALLRYTRATVDFDYDGQRISLKVGNVQIGGGLRLRF
jgi:opacity protein-like surface antigen